jgi:hypothetical protein
MPVDLDRLRPTFTEGMLPHWPCPACAGRLRLPEGRLLEDHTAESRDSLNHPAWEPDWASGRFAALLACAACGESVAASGSYSVSLDYDESEYGQPYKVYTVKFFNSAPKLIVLPEATPSPIRDELEKSFHLFWYDAESCAGRIRATVEALLDHARVNRSTINNKRKRVPLTLHTRIEAFKKSQPELGDALMAVKWIGNAGAHAKPVQRDDVMDGYQLIEHVLDALFADRASRASRLAKQINRAKKPRSAGKPNAKQRRQ